MVLITGASGFVGQHLVQLLSAQGSGEIRALYHRRAPDDRLQRLAGVQWVQCDLLDIFSVGEAMQGVHEVYHCAAVVSFQPGMKEEMMQVNITGTTHVINAALEAQVRKLVFISSVAALGRNIQGREITEEVQWEEGGYNSAYAQSKYYAEMEVWRGIAEGLNAAVLNPGIILGEGGDWEAGSARLMKLVDDEFPFYTRGINGWVDVRDVVKAAFMLMNSDISAERFILSAGNFSYKQVFTLMAEALGRRPPRYLATAFMTGLVWRWNMIRSRFSDTGVTVTKETARTARQICYYNNEKLTRFFPEFHYAELSETIGRMAVAYRADRLSGNSNAPGK